MTKPTAPLTFAEALETEQAARRFTPEHIPEWAHIRRRGDVRYPAPQYRSDREWYERSGVQGVPLPFDPAKVSAATFPFGQFLPRPYEIETRKKAWVTEIRNPRRTATNNAPRLYRICVPYIEAFTPYRELETVDFTHYRAAQNIANGINASVRRGLAPAKRKTK